MPRTFVTDCEGFHRRDFLKIGAGGLFGLTLPQLLRLEAQAAPERRKQRANAVIMLWLGGGPAISTCGTSSPMPRRAFAASSSRSRPRRTACKSANICRKWRRMADKITIVRSLYHTIPSHGPATVFMTTGNKPTPAVQYPSLGSLTAKLMPLGGGRAALCQLQRHPP